MPCFLLEKHCAQSNFFCQDKKVLIWIDYKFFIIPNQILFILESENYKIRLLVIFYNYIAYLDLHLLQLI
jgi:hypothetical protein